MNCDEEIAEVYLKSLGLGSPIFEPDGNIPPDFSLPGGIAVEVRRLNKHSFEHGTPVGLEQAEYPLLGAIQAVMKEFNRDHSARSFLVFVKFDRPIPQKKDLQSSLRGILHRFLTGSLTSQKNITVAENVAIDIIPASKNHGRPFLMGGDSDAQRGGWLLDDMEKNIQHSSDEKEKKVEPYRNKYSQWWLVLIDHIGYSLNDLDRQYFARDVSIKHKWHKLVLVDPRDGNRAHEI